jgi:hypothetical protein
MRWCQYLANLGRFGWHTHVIFIFFTHVPYVVFCGRARALKYVFGFYYYIIKKINSGVHTTPNLSKLESRAVVSIFSKFGEIWLTHARDLYFFYLCTICSILRESARLVPYSHKSGKYILKYVFGFYYYIIKKINSGVHTTPNLPKLESRAS